MHAFRLSSLLVLTVLALALPVHADEALDAAETVLKSEGLTKQGSAYVLPEEAEVNKGAAELRKVQTDLAKASRELEKEEKRMAQIKAFIASKEFEARKLYDELSKGNLTVERNNQLVGKLKVIEDEIKKIKEGPYKAAGKEHNEANDAFIKLREEFIQKTVTLEHQAEKLNKRYEELAASEDVKKAIADVSTATKMKATLGPGAGFKGNLLSLRKARKDILSEKIDVKIENNVPWVDAIIDGKTRQPMVLDSGAGLVTLPHDVAQKLGLIPTKDTPQIRLTLADGKIVEGWLMSVKSITVGPFTVENVECAVLPENLIAAHPLLGGTFLKNFVYKLDLTAQKLDMSKVKEPGAK